MRVGLLSSVIVSVVTLAACTVTSTNDPPGSNTNPPSTNDPPSGGDGGTPSSSDKPPAAKTAAPIDIDGTCPAFAACGGSPQGTYDYRSGCVDDVFADVRNSCPAVVTDGVDVTVTGSIYFLGNALHRSVTTQISGSIVFPASCTFGQCAMLQTQLGSAYDSISCTGSSSCTCTISDSKKTEDATTYTISGSTLTTADGDTYSICENGSDFEYKGAGAGSEQGVFQLKKR